MQSYHAKKVGDLAQENHELKVQADGTIAELSD